MAMSAARLKIQLLYDDIEHARPMLRAAEHFGEFGVELRPVQTSSPESAIRLVQPDIDVLMIHQTLMSDDALDHGKPVVILERIDGAQLAASRKWLSRISSTGDEQPSVAGVIKGYTFREIGVHNSYRGRCHAHLLRAAGVVEAADGISAAVPGLPSPQIAQADLRKIHAGYGFGAYAKMGQPRQQMVDFSAQRDIAVHCVCYVNYRGSEIETHRRAAVAAVHQWAGDHGGQWVTIGEGRVLNHSDYLQMMFRSRVVVSPWGWGEACHRDYEAMLLGAVLVKPPMGHIVCWPDIYRPNETYIPCRLDFADLPEIIDRVTREWGAFRKDRELAHKLAYEAGEPKRIAKRIAHLLREKILC